jgi:chromosomal replication initiator protein
MIVHHIWEEFLKIMREEAGNQIVETWFKAVSFEKWDPASAHVILRAPNQFVKNWIEEHYIPLLKTHLARLLHAKHIIISFNNSIQEPVERSIIPASVITNKYVSTSSAHSAKKEALVVAPQTNFPGKRAGASGKNVLNSSYVFDNFVVGPNNSLAHAASWAICDNLG